jgi:hypothetical protein
MVNEVEPGVEAPGNDQLLDRGYFKTENGMLEVLTLPMPYGVWKKEVTRHGLSISQQTELLIRKGLIPTIANLRGEVPIVLAHLKGLPSSPFFNQ